MKNLVTPGQMQNTKGAACKRGETTIVQLLMDHFNSEECGLNTRDTDGLTPFHWACYRGQTDIVKLLLEHSGSNINLNARDNYDITAFMLACDKGRKDVVQLLLNFSGSDIELNLSLNAKDTQRWTATVGIPNKIAKGFCSTFLHIVQLFGAMA